MTDEIDAGREFIQRLNDYSPVKAACWLLGEDGGIRYLYVALDDLDANKKGLAYDEVHHVTQEMKDHYINPFRVKLIDTKHPIAKALINFYRRFPGPTPRRFDRAVLGGVPIGEAYIYPPLSAMN